MVSFRLSQPCENYTLSGAYESSRRLFLLSWLGHEERDTQTGNSRQQIRLKLTTHAIRSIEHNGGLDSYLANTADKNLPEAAKRLKRRIEKAAGKAAGKAAA